MSKIIDTLNAYIERGQPFYSFEFFPPKTDEGVRNLQERQRRMVKLGPAFCDITWGAGGSTADVTLEVAGAMQQEIGMNTMMHLTCTNMSIEKLHESLEKAKSMGIRNILALRGDPPKGETSFTAVDGGFACALDLVKYIRQEYGDYFGICVSGYPETHPDLIVDDPVAMEANYRSDLAYLKAKVEAGADFIITQLFYDVDCFLAFMRDCRVEGIAVPILPGLMPLMTYGGFKRMTAFCKTRVPAHIAATVEALKDNDEAIKAYGISLGTLMAQRLLDAGAPGIHMYTLNLEKSAVGILQHVGLVKVEPEAEEAEEPQRLAATA
ncbi:Methylenetetrahydrofolate reductase 1 [Auxenochlorella protothecoides]|uniref:Methylenetetrahydrofolate reductase 1 n=2 Tax=Auxenochlorella protothecoides TaxID=3075 RepID=A0A087SQI2_AUXPR|nr:Methylenetetrahydrofolate reductase 1 [Auxenochlorella protothecoides]KFM27986.1 Methylenetetrahydrofolate reductase 1 [Auxenochlorella protothecoides]